MIRATLVYLTRENKTLMIHRCKREKDQHKGKYNGLGGKFEEGETPYDCAKREVFEESGLMIDSMKLKGVLTFPRFDKEGRDWLVFIYRAEAFHGEQKSENPEGVLEWISNDKLLDLPLWEGDRTFIKAVFEERFFEGKFFYEDGRLVNHELFFS